jgi:hypothetical protein
MKQTAVEWLIDQLITENEVTLKGENYKLFEMAIEIEKEKNHSEYMRGWKDGLTKQGPPPPPLDRKIYR